MKVRASKRKRAAVESREVDHQSPRPSEPEPFLFSLVVTAYGWLPALVRRGISAFFFTLSPDVPVDLRDSFRDSTRRRVAVASAGSAFVFCFVVPAALCAVEGTLRGPDATRLYFFQDWWNIVLYTLVCPAYVSVAACIIVTTFQHWSSTNQFARVLAGEASPSRTGRRFGVALFAILLICGVSTSTYMYDSLRSDTVPVLYWFMEGGAPLRALNRAGYYYVALNFGLLFVTAAAAFCFFSMAMEAMRVGQSLESGGVRHFRELRDRLSAFTEVYLLTKTIAALYMINTIIWKASPLGGGGATINIIIAGALLTGIGVFFIAVPRLYVELKWFQFQSAERRIRGGADDDDPSYEDLRPPRVRLGSYLLDLLVIGAFISAFWGLDFNPLDWLRR